MKFFKIKELNISEMFVLALYRQEQDENNCCILKNIQVANKVNISIGYLKKIKRHLKELGYIRTDGIKVFYLGIDKDENNQE